MNRHTVTEFARMTGFTRETVAKRMDGVKPVAQRKPKGELFTLRQFVDAFTEYNAPSARPKTGEIDPEFEKARKDREIADKYELANAQRRGELLEASDVEKTWSGIIHQVRTKLLAIPAKLAPVMVAIDDPAMAQEEITVAVHECLDALAQDE
jgi:phage terminase Nu1 subunit (DNA packaging protein)